MLEKQVLHRETWLVPTPTSSTTTDQMLLVFENGGTLSIFCWRHSVCFVTRFSINTVVCLETRARPRDFIFCSQSGPADGVIILVFGHSSHILCNTTGIGLLYRAPNAGRIPFWGEKEKSRVSVCTLMYVCMCVCISEGKILPVLCVSIKRILKKK